MHWQTIALIVIPIALVDTIVIGAVFNYAINGGWKAIERQFPGRPAAPDAIRRNFGSMRIGIANFGNCVHFEADAAYLHLRPTWFLRRLGCGAASIPWDAITSVKKGRFGTARAKLGRTHVVAPWELLRLADPSSVPDARA